MELNLEVGFPEAAINALDVGLFRGRVALRIGMEDGSVYEGYLKPAEAVNLVDALRIAAQAAETSSLLARQD